MTSKGRATAPLCFGAAAALAFALAGCGGAQSQIPMQGSTQSALSRGGSIEPDACKSQGGVRAMPCRVQLTASNPSITVTLRTPQGSKGSIVEHDTCGGASGIASITGSGDTWQVTAGAVQGNCKARFNYFNNSQKAGWVQIKIQNQV